MAKNKSKNRRVAEHDVHERTEKLFADLLSKTSDKNTEVLLKALRWVCIVVEENGVGIQDHKEEVGKSLTLIKDNLDCIANKG